MKRIVVFLILFVVCHPARARVFVMAEEHFAAYLHGDFGSTSVGVDPLTQASETGVSYDARYTQLATYGMGFAWRAAPFVNFRFGVDVLKPSSIKDAIGTDASGTALYHVDNDIVAIIPEVGAELTFKQWGNSRVFGAGQFDYGDVTTQNNFTLTSAGQTAHPGVADYSEQVTGVTLGWQASGGFESVLSNSTTFVLEVGYRQLQFTTLKQNAAVTTVQGTVAKGDPALDGAGNPRSLNLSGYFVSAALRFWIF